MISQIELTKIFLQAGNISIDDTNIKLYSRKLWKSTRKASSYRLSEEGFDYLTNTLDLVSYEIEFNEPIKPCAQSIVSLEKFINCPYYITAKSIIVFSEKKAVELSLFAADIDKFLMQKLIKSRRQRS